MDVYLAGTAVSVEVPFADEHGNPQSPTSASYRVLAEDGIVLVAKTDVTIADGETSAKVTTTPLENTLNGVAKGLRTIELTLETASGTIVIFSRYIVETHSVVEVGVSSFQTHGEALLEANYMIDVDVWLSSASGRQTASLMEAFTNLMRLNYSKTSSSLQGMTAEELALIDPELLSALKKAQVAEADFLLGGESVGDKRRIGLLSESIGESSQMFRSGKPLKLPVSEKALGYLSGQISWSIGVRRC